MTKTQKNSLTKKKLGPQLGFRTSDHFRGSKFSQRGQQQKPGGFNPTMFRQTQHKG